MLINKTKRAEQNLNNLPFLALQAEQIEFLGSPAEFKTQIIELIRNAKNVFMSPHFIGKKMKRGRKSSMKFIA